MNNVRCQNSVGKIENKNSNKRNCCPNSLRLWAIVEILIGIWAINKTPVEVPTLSEFHLNFFAPYRSDRGHHDWEP